MKPMKTLPEAEFLQEVRPEVNTLYKHYNDMIVKFTMASFSTDNHGLSRFFQKMSREQVVQRDEIANYLKSLDEPVSNSRSHAENQLESKRLTASIRSMTDDKSLIEECAGDEKVLLEEVDTIMDRCDQDLEVLLGKHKDILKMRVAILETI